MSDSQLPKPKLRWYQFSLRNLLIVVLLAGLVFGWLGHRIQRIRNEIRATAELEKLGAEIEFYSHKNWNELPIPDRWLWKWFGDEPVHWVIFGGPQTNDTDLEHLKKLSNLQELWFFETQVADAGLKNLEELTNLRELWFFKTQVTDAGLKHLEGLTNLQDLDLDGTQITDAGLRHLERLSSLKVMALKGAHVTDAGLQHLKGLTSLLTLDLTNTQVSQAGVENLQKALPKCDISH